VNELALFAGAGGGILGGHLLGWRTVCAVEWEQYPASVLCARQNDGLLPSFPIWDDVQTFDGKPWQGIVDVVSGGFPCQDISAAGRGGESRQSDQECGKKWQESLAKLDQNTLLWKIPQCSLLEDLVQSLEIWPKWGSMRSGECYPQPMLERTTKESEFGYWLTPTATAISGRSQKAMEYRTKQRESQGHNTVQPGNLAEQVIYSGKMPCKDMKNPTWPTPVSSPSVTSQTVGATLDLMNSRERGQGTLMEAVVKRMFPTPQASDNRDRGNMSNPSIQRRIAKGKQIMLSQSVDQNSGQLNPPWVEWLMGWPLGWTDLKPLEMDKCHFVQQQHLTC